MSLRCFCDGCGSDKAATAFLVDIKDPESGRVIVVKCESAMNHEHFCVKCLLSALKDGIKHKKVREPISGKP